MSPVPVIRKRFGSGHQLPYISNNCFQPDSAAQATRIGLMNDSLNGFSPSRVPHGLGNRVTEQQDGGPTMPAEIQPVETDPLVNLDQIAAMVYLSKRTLQKYVKEMPVPRRKGRGGRESLWAWSEVRPWLAKRFDMPKIAEHFPNYFLEEMEDQD
jgi:predicted DNA-binding transcriptional regulator AlpA